MKVQRLLTLTASGEQEVEIVDSWIRSRKQEGRDLQILEAGCGKKWALNLEGMSYFLTGVDLDGTALRLRLEGVKDLDRAVEGDLRTVQFESESFDVIYNAFVLEHVSGAEEVLSNFATWLRRGGVAVIQIPDPYSVYGFLSRVTPHWFHVLYYRYVRGIANAGSPGYLPYPVCYDPVVSRDGLHRFCKEKGLSVIAEYGTGGHYRPGKGILRWAISTLKRLAAALSLGKLSVTHDNLLFIIQKT